MSSQLPAKMRVLIFAKGKKAGARFFLLLCVLLSLAAHVLFIQFFELIPQQAAQSQSSLQQCFYVDSSLQPALAGFASGARMRSSLPLYSRSHIASGGLDVDYFHGRLDSFSILSEVQTRPLPYGFANNWLDVQQQPLSLPVVSLQGFERSFVGNAASELVAAKLQLELLAVQGELGLAQFISFEQDASRYKEQQWLGKSARFLLTVDPNGVAQSVFLLHGSMDDGCDQALQELLQGSKWQKAAAPVRSAVVELGWKGQ